MQPLAVDYSIQLKLVERALPTLELFATTHFARGVVVRPKSDEINGSLNYP